ncbi:MAG: response regulator [Pseudomonadota bacterium]
MTGLLTSPHREQYSLLVVDDNETSLLLMSEFLRNHDYHVEAVSSGYQAIAYAQENHPDLILLDVMMSGLNGFETCKLLKANPITEAIPIIFITALANTEDIVRGFEVGGADYIVKPFNSSEIIARIKTQLKVLTLTRQLRNTQDLQEQEVLRRTEELEVANSALNASRNLLQSVLDAVPEQLLVVDRKFNIIFSNNRNCQVADLTEDSQVCRTCFGRFRKMAEPCKKCAVFEVFENGKSVEQEVISKADGRVWEMRAFPIFDETGALPLAVEYIRETTSIKKVERENERRRQFLESVLLEAPDAIVTLDDKHQVIDWNPGAVRMFGYQPEEARGRHLDNLVARGKSLTEAGEKTRSLLSGRTIEPFETVRQRRDGSAIQVIAAASPIQKDGNLIGAVAVYTDISAIKSTAGELRRSHELLLTVLESIDSTIYVVDKDSYEILFMNQQMQKQFGGDLSGGICWRDFHQRSGPCLSCLNAFMEGDYENPSEVCVSEDFDADTGRWFRKHHRIIKWVDHRLVWLQMASDISDHKRIEQERKDYERRIRQLQKMEAIGTLAGGIAHDFNNILSAVFGYAELSLLQAGDFPVLQRNLAGILEAAKRAKELVQQILLFSRQGEQELKPLQLKPLIKETLKMLRSSLPTTIQIEIEIDGVFENVLANPTQIHQILMNLCTNAAQAMEDDSGVLTVALSQIELTEESLRRHPGHLSGTYLKLRVQDTGRGIPADIIDKIFNPYFTTKAKGQGTGLGLSVVHGIIESYSGIIEVDSELGRGTVFDIFLPVIHLEALSEKISAGQLPTGSEHILLVDDEAMLIEVLGGMLGLLGYRVTSTQSSSKAVELFQMDPASFDLLITDMTMPELTGDRLTAEIRNIRPDIPVIICTGYNRRLSDHKPEALAVQAILMKPVEQLDLARTVREVLDGRSVTARQITSNTNKWEKK